MVETTTTAPLQPHSSPGWCAGCGLARPLDHSDWFVTEDNHLLCQHCKKDQFFVGWL